MRSCAGTKSYNNLVYSWTVAVWNPGESVANPVDTMRSVSQSPAVFKVPPYILMVGAEYTITLAVMSASSGLSGMSVVKVTVTSAGLSAVLSGGSRQYAQVADTVTLDASGSSDLDYPDRVGAGAGLLFSWKCVQTAPAFSVACPLSLAASSYGIAAAAVAFEAFHTTSLITVTVSDGSTRSSSAQVEVLEENLALLGSLNLLAPCSARWSVDDPSIVLRDAARTQVEQYLAPSSSGGLSFNLVLSAGSLPQRASLVFTLGCDNTTSSTSVNVKTNGAPLPGLFTVTPTGGEELTTLFTFSAAQWSDPDLPLTYQFGFESDTSLSNLVVVSRSELSYTSTKLPVGAEKRNFHLNCTLSVFDSIGATADSIQYVTVVPVSPEQRDASLQILLQSNAGSADSTRSILSVVSTVLNNVNCSAALNCTTYNRSPCLRTSGQCGACLSGFVGDLGDRNTLCMPVYALTNTTETTCGEGGGCSSWQSCEAGTGRCATLPKTCGSDCSGRGTCIFLNRKYGTHLPLCLLSDSGCDAVCSCQDHYSGVFCEIDNTALQRQRAIRSSLISSLDNLTRIDDISAESVGAWSASLYSLSLHPHDLSVNDVRAVVAIANTTLAHALLLGVRRYQDIVGVLQATDAVASLLKYNYNPNDYRSADFNTLRGYLNSTAAEMIPVLSAFADLVTGAQVLGEPRSDLIYDNFRITAKLVSMGSTAVTLTAPQSDEEQAISTPATTVSLVGDSPASVAVKLLQINPREYRASAATSFVSTPILLQMQGQQNHRLSSFPPSSSPSCTTSPSISTSSTW
jgi:hypothetical protein